MKKERDVAKLRRWSSEGGRVCPLVRSALQPRYLVEPSRTGGAITVNMARKD
jgi:hypothetical protein